MKTIPKNKIRKGHCLALFPGAFRPPHINHYSAALDLASRPDVDEVIVIVTNRCRNVPGTTKTLDTDVAVRIWSIYLQYLPKVRVEVAPKSAVKHALGYFDRVNVGDTLLFCVGESDFRKGDGRFKKIDAMGKRTGVAASIIEGPPNTVPIRATHLRKAIALGDEGRETFMAALPIHLNSAQRTKVWSTCQQGMKEMRDIVMEKVRALIEINDLGEIDDIGIAKSGKRDEVFRAGLTNGTCLYVKYANDTVKAAKMGIPGDPKPRKRLKAERDALKWLKANTTSRVEIPIVVHFDRGTRTLIMTEVCPGGKTLQDNLKEAIFDPVVAKEASRFLAECHSTGEQLDPLWDEEEADLSHWRTMLALRTIRLESDGFSDKIHEDLERLKDASDNAREQRFVNLDFCPKNILIGELGIGVIDFELSSSIGDPAYDFGLFLGQYLFWGLVTSSGRSCQEALHEALNAYQQRIGPFWLSMRSRVVAFAGASILHSVAGKNRPYAKELEPLLLTTGVTLLSKGLHQIDDIVHIFSNAAIGRLGF